jgi:hypothetical protein
VGETKEQADARRREEVLGHYQWIPRSELRLGSW